ncbi:iron ABC transporter substrate-binding protein [Actinomyces sp. 432]|uniref:ABC transporter substrate-binding protein n=2 Tax=Actinomyces TaxID=1654 RepID=UPI0013745F3E|nr:MULTISPECIES: ABC transporter substrate-binding protein [unclassified Actinomyces]MBW3068731.1 ABC transporter substrate-binding protein [Actinomyces sp. 594]QHO90180.1 iron ABC transporter substrate-binding protein [Actinomyces sp. 432]
MRTFSRYGTAMLAAVMAGGLALSGCAGSTDSGSSAAGSDEGPITIACGAMEDLCQAWTDKFTETTGIKATYVRLSSGETVARLASAKDNPEFDVWHGGPVDGYGEAVNQGLIEAYTSPEAEKIPAEYKDPDGNWTGVYIGALGFCSNQSQLDKLGVDAPASWDDLLDPALKGQISVAHPSTSGTAFTTLWTQVTRLGGEDAGMDYMKRLHNNVLQYSKSGTAPGQIAGRGEAAVGLVFSHDCVKYQEEGMTDLVVSFPEEGTGYEVGGVALVAGSSHKAAAQAYIDFAISAEGQNVGQTVGSYQVLTNPDADTSDKMANLDDINLIDYDFAAAAAAKPDLTARFDEEIAAEPKE